MRIAPIKGLQGSTRQYTCFVCGSEWKTNRYDEKGRSDCPHCHTKTPHDGSRTLRVEFWYDMKQTIYQQKLEEGIWMTFDELVKETQRYMEMI